MYKIIGVIFTCFMAGVLAVNSSFAQTTATHSGVVVRSDDGVMYLTTEVVPSSTTATSTTPPPPPRNENSNYFFPDINIDPPAGFFEDLTALFNQLIRIVLALSALLSFFYLIWGGFQWITSGGDKGKTEKARSTIFAAIIGLILVASSYAVLLLVLNFLGYEDLNEVLDQANMGLNN